MNKHYRREGALPGPDQPVEFEGEEIRLDLPMEEMKINDKWTIVPLIDPMVSSYTLYMTIDSYVLQIHRYLIYCSSFLDNQERGG